MTVSPLQSTVRALGGKVFRALQAEAFARWQRQPVRATAVLYESFAGNGMLCNPEAIFRALLNDPEFEQLEHLWVLRSRRENRDTIAEFRRHPRVRFVRFKSFAYFRALATSGYLINNATFPPQYGRRPGQLYLNTWHGTPLKRMGYDIGDQAARVANVIRNFLSADFLLSANTFMTERLYESAHRLRGIYAGALIEAGYPRIDHQFVDADTVAAHRAALEAAGVHVGSREIILYAPTWKGSVFSRPDDDIAALAERLNELDRRIDTSRYVVLLKTHQVVHHFAHTVPGLAARLVPNTMPANVALSLTSVLITDYSSIFFDLLATRRPVIFLVPDINDYTDYRGLYLEPNRWPGPVVSTIAEVAEEIHRLGTGTGTGAGAPTNPHYEPMRELISPHEDGHATARVIDVVFRGNSQNVPLRDLGAPALRRVLVNAGTLGEGPEGELLVKRLDERDFSTEDVTVIFTNNQSSEAIALQKRLNPQVRQIARVGSINGFLLGLRYRRLAAIGRDSEPKRRRGDQALWDAEWLRCFGLSTFDEVIDWGVNSALLSELVRHAPSPHS